MVNNIKAIAPSMEKEGNLESPTFVPPLLTPTHLMPRESKILKNIHKNILHSKPSQLGPEYTWVPVSIQHSHPFSYR